MMLLRSQRNLFVKFCVHLLATSARCIIFFITSDVRKALNIDLFLSYIRLLQRYLGLSFKINYSKSLFKNSTPVSCTFYCNVFIRSSIDKSRSKNCSLTTFLRCLEQRESPRIISVARMKAMPCAEPRK